VIQGRRSPTRTCGAGAGTGLPPPTPAGSDAGADDLDGVQHAEAASPYGLTGRLRSRGRRRFGADRADHLARQRHPQRPARPGTARRPLTRWPGSPHPPATPRPDRRDMAQPPHRPARPAVPDRLRPL